MWALKVPPRVAKRIPRLKTKRVTELSFGEEIRSGAARTPFACQVRVDAGHYLRSMEGSLNTT